MFSFKWEPAFESDDATLNLLIELQATILKMFLIFRKLSKSEMWKTKGLCLEILYAIYKGKIHRCP